ncbi:MAG: histidine phosphatase family protein [Steroidobacteraceae bacterium]|nr:histidine phosphatase family protein [Steroidobacteraceae bacterium]
MDLLLWRHAQAADGMPDLERPLTERGRAQARAMAEWLRPRLPAGLRILVSPARRARETAAALGLPFEIVEAIAPDADAATVLSAAGWPDADRPALIVGHQPTLGAVAATLLTGNPSPLHVAKGAVWWLRARGGDARDAALVAALGPKLLG